ncbi:hypothetical protein CBL_07366 [Carabus blaptoides fortunei]
MSEELDKQVEHLKYRETQQHQVYGYSVPNIPTMCYTSEEGYFTFQCQGCYYSVFLPTTEKTTGVDITLFLPDSSYITALCRCIRQNTCQALQIKIDTNLYVLVAAEDEVVSPLFLHLPL